MVDTASTGLILAAAVGIPVFIVLILVFEFTRNKFPHIFQYRKYLVENKVKYPEFNNENGAYLEYITPQPSTSMFGWLSATLSLSEDDVIKTVSFDAALAIMSLRNRFYFYTITSLLACVILIPVYATSTSASGDGEAVEGVATLSLANVGENDNRLWATFVVDVLMVGLALLYVLYEANNYTKRREQYRSADIGANYAIAVQDLPANVTSVDQVVAAFDAVFPGEVEGAQLVYDSKSLRTAFKNYGVALNSREKVEWTILNKDVERPRHRVTPCTCCFKPTVDSLDYWTQKQRELADEINEDQERMTPKVVRRTQSAIVIFRTKRAAALADQAQIFSRPLGKWTITRLDSFKRVHWPGIKKNRLMGTIFSVNTWVWMAVFLILWLPISAFIQSLASLENLQKTFPWISIPDSAILKTIIEGYLPIVLTIVLSMIPQIMIKIFVSLERWPSVGLMVNKQRTMLFIYVFIVNFIYVIGAGTVLEYLDLIRQGDFEQIIQILATGIPQKATFFLTFVLTACFIGNGMALSQIVRVIVTPILGIIFKTPRAKKLQYGMFGTFAFAPLYGSSAFLSTVALIYSSMAPLILPFAAVFFGLTFIVVKHNLCFTSYNNGEDGGSIFWGHLQIMFVGLYLRSIAMIGIYALKQAPVPSACSVVAVVVIIYVHYYIHSRFRRLGWEGSLEFTGPKVAEMDVNPAYVDKYITPEMKPLGTVPTLLELDVFKPTKEGGKEVEDGETEAIPDSKTEAVGDEFYDAAVNDKIAVDNA